MTRLSDLPTDQKNPFLTWTSEVLVALSTEDSATYYSVDGPRQRQHLWIVTDLGLHHFTWGPGRGPSAWSKIAELHPWPEVKQPRVTFVGAPKGPGWDVTVTIDVPAFSASHGSDRMGQVLTEFAVECVRRSTASLTLGTKPGTSQTAARQLSPAPAAASISGR